MTSVRGVVGVGHEGTECPHLLERIIYVDYFSHFKY